MCFDNSRQRLNENRRLLQKDKTKKRKRQKTIKIICTPGMKNYESMKHFRWITTFDAKLSNDVICKNNEISQLSTENICTNFVYRKSCKRYAQHDTHQKLFKS